MTMKVISLFSGCGGLDLGFEAAGFEIAWANDFDKSIWETYRKNFPDSNFDTRDIRTIKSSEIPDNIFGIIGGPPCQSWSEAGALRGLDDERGLLFFEYIRLLRDKSPAFFLAENVPGMLFPRHRDALDTILESFDSLDYDVSYKLLNVHDYGVPQDRKRVIFVGYHRSLGIPFRFPSCHKQHLVLHNAIEDISDSAIPALEKNYSNGDTLAIPNHEYMIGGFSSIYMSRNRVRNWDEPSFTIQAGGRHAPLHPQANKMIKMGKDQFIFDPENPLPYRRLSLRECARIQTFPDDFIFYYQRLADGYKMVGNAVPPKFAKTLAEQIYLDMTSPQPDITLSQIEKVKQLKLF